MKTTHPKQTWFHSRTMSVFVLRKLDHIWYDSRCKTVRFNGPGQERRRSNQYLGAPKHALAPARILSHKFRQGAAMQIHDHSPPEEFTQETGYVFDHETWAAKYIEHQN